MRKIVSTIVLLLVLHTLANPQPIPTYYSTSRFLFTSPGVFQEGLLGFVNPANLTMLKTFDSRVMWSTEGTNIRSVRDWGVFAGTHHFGFGALRQKIGTWEVTNYRTGASFGNYGNAFGLSYSWSTANGSPWLPENFITTGWLSRPNSYLSIGLVGNFSTQSKARQGIADIGLRPFGTDLITLFADAAVRTGQKIKDVPWSTGAVVRIARGINLTGRYFNDKTFTLGLSIDFGNSGMAQQAHFYSDRKHSYNIYSLRTGAFRKSLFTNLFKKKIVVPFNLRGKVDYNKYTLFDKSTHRFMDILNDIRDAAADPRVGAIAINLSDASIRPEHAWELREELSRFREKGKQVYVFIDNGDMTTYHLASVADKIILDPEGMILLEGFRLGRTYFKGTLEKLGLGFDEWRFFKYKSAYESYSRDKMSDADREQRQDYVDDWYELVRGDVCASRHFNPEKFDDLVDKQTLFMPSLALEQNLVDTLGRWSDVDNILKKLAGKKWLKVPHTFLMANTMQRSKWGEPAKIAVVYGLGECAMDTGIKARWLERVFLKLAKNKSIRAVVFRVDSPGGEVMASDLVAEALKKCSEKKPIIISQGQVAGSGGYWISMYGDTIVAGPNTVTGSIGVIGGWIWDKSLSKKLGLSSDLVQRGAHADIGFGATLPLLGVQVPARNLTPEERSMIEKMIKDMYDNFVGKVAKGRHMPEEKVKEIAQGHFYSGVKGKEIGLVDEIGGIVTAIAIAREKIGLKPDEEIELIEIPKSKGLFNMQFGLPSLETKIANDPVIRYLRLATRNPYRPLMMMLPGSYPE